MNVLQVILFTLLQTIVYSQEYACPKNTVISTCEWGPNSCLYDSTCHTPGDRCCSWGCGGQCIPPVQYVADLCTNGEPAEDGSGNQLFCGRGPTRVDCPSGTSCNIHPADAYAVCCPDATCRNKACPADNLCYMNQVQCVTTPCPALPTCYTHPCKNMICPGNEECRLTGGCDGKCEATVQCGVSAGNASYGGFLTIVASGLTLLVCIGFSTINS